MMVIGYVTKTMVWWTVEVLDIGSCGCNDDDVMTRNVRVALMMTKIIYSM